MYVPCIFCCFYYNQQKHSYVINLTYLAFHDQVTVHRDMFL